MVDDVENCVIDLYRRHARAWAEARGERKAEGPWVDRVTSLIPTGTAILDIGCGPGKPIAAELVRREFSVTGLDAVPEMLERFRDNAPGQASILTDMRTMALGQRFAGLLAWDSLFHLPPSDQRSMFPRFAEHAAPGAALMFTSGPAEGVAIGELEGEPLYHSSLGPDEYRALLSAAGFEVVGHVAEDSSCGLRTVWLARQHAQ